MTNLETAGLPLWLALRVEYGFATPQEIAVAVDLADRKWTPSAGDDTLLTSCLVSCEASCTRGCTDSCTRSCTDACTRSCTDSCTGSGCKFSCTRAGETGN